MPSVMNTALKIVVGLNLLILIFATDFSCKKTNQISNHDIYDEQRFYSTQHDGYSTKNIELRSNARPHPPTHATTLVSPNNFKIKKNSTETKLGCQNYVFHWYKSLHGWRPYLKQRTTQTTTKIIFSFQNSTGNKGNNTITTMIALWPWLWSTIQLPAYRIEADDYSSLPHYSQLPFENEKREKKSTR